MDNPTLVEYLGEDPATKLPVYLLRDYDDEEYYWAVVCRISRDRFLFLECDNYWSTECSASSVKKEVIENWKSYLESLQSDAHIANVVDNSGREAIKETAKDSKQSDSSLKETTSVPAIPKESVVNSPLDPYGNIILETNIKNGKIFTQVMRGYGWEIRLGDCLRPNKLREVAESLNNFWSNQEPSGLSISIGPNTFLHTGKSDKQSIRIGDVSLNLPAHATGHISTHCLNRAADAIDKAMKPVPEPVKEDVADKPTPNNRYNFCLFSPLDEAKKVMLETCISSNKILNQSICGHDWSVNVGKSLCPTVLREVANDLANPNIFVHELHETNSVLLSMTKDKQQRIITNDQSIALLSPIAERCLREAADKIEQAITPAKEPIVKEEIAVQKQPELSPKNGSYTLIENLGTDPITKLPVYLMQGDSKFFQIGLSLYKDRFLFFNCTAPDLPWQIDNCDYSDASIPRSYWERYIINNKPRDFMKNYNLLACLGDDPITNLPVYTMEYQYNGKKLYQIALILKENGQFLFLNPSFVSQPWQVHYCPNTLENLLNFWKRHVKTSRRSELINVIDKCEKTSITQCYQDIKQKILLDKRPISATIKCYLDIEQWILLETTIVNNQIDEQILRIQGGEYSNLNVEKCLTPDMLRIIVKRMREYFSNEKDDLSYLLSPQYNIWLTVYQSKSQIQKDRTPCQLPSNLAPSCLERAAEGIEKALAIKEQDPSETVIEKTRNSGVIMQLHDHPEELKDQVMKNHALIECLGNDPVTDLPVYVMQAEYEKHNYWQIVMKLPNDKVLFFQAFPFAWKPVHTFRADQSAMMNEWRNYLASNHSCTTIGMLNLCKAPEPETDKLITYLDKLNTVTLKTTIKDHAIVNQQLHFDGSVIDVNNELTPDKIIQLAKSMDDFFHTGSIPTLTLSLSKNIPLVLHTPLKGSPQKLMKDGPTVTLPNPIRSTCLKRAAKAIEEALAVKTPEEIKQAVAKMDQIAENFKQIRKDNPKEQNKSEVMTNYLDSKGNISLQTFFHNNVISEQILGAPNFNMVLGNLLPPAKLRSLADELDNFLMSDKSDKEWLTQHVGGKDAIFIQTNHIKKQSIWKCGEIYSLPHLVSPTNIKLAAQAIEDKLRELAQPKEVVQEKQQPKDDKVITSYLNRKKTVVLESVIEDHAVTSQKLYITSVLGCDGIINASNKVFKTKLTPDKLRSLADKMDGFHSSRDDIMRSRGLSETINDGDDAVIFYDYQDYSQIVVKKDSQIVISHPITSAFLRKAADHIDQALRATAASIAAMDKTIQACPINVNPTTHGVTARAAFFAAMDKTILQAYRLNLNPITEGVKDATKEQPADHKKVTVKTFLDHHDTVWLETDIMYKEVVQQRLRTTTLTVQIDKWLTPSQLIDLANERKTSNGLCSLSLGKNSCLYLPIHGIKSISIEGTTHALPCDITSSRLELAAKELKQFLMSEETIAKQQPWQSWTVHNA